MGDFNNEKYPVSSLKPKAETGVLSFLGKYPNFNGSDVTIAVLDSGVDPNAAGLQVSYARKKNCFYFNQQKNSRHFPMVHAKSSNGSIARDAETSACQRLCPQHLIQSRDCREES